MLVHLFDRNRPILEEAIFRFVDDPHASLANRSENPVTSLEQMVRCKKPNASARC